MKLHLKLLRQPTIAVIAQLCFVVLQSAQAHDETRDTDENVCKLYSKSRI